MYQIQLTTRGDVSFSACGDGGQLCMPENELEALLVYIRQGTAQIAYKTLKETAFVGDVISADAAASITFSQDAAYYWLLFSHENLHLLSATAICIPNPDEYVIGMLSSCVRPAQLNFLFKYLIDSNTDELFADQKRKYLAGLILCEVSEQFFYPKTSRYNQRFLDILGWLQTHFMEPFSLDEISGRFQYNKVYLCRLFREKIGESIYAYVTRLRIEKAMALLAGTNDTIKDIARQVGYSNEKQFIRNFRQQNKITATQYRLQCVGKPFHSENSE